MPTLPDPEGLLAAPRSTSDAVLAIGVALLANVPLAIWGPPGAGKTSLLRSIAFSLGWPIHALTATIQQPTDFAGLRFLSGGTLTARTLRAPLDWAVTLAEEAEKRGGRGLIFFDDVAFAPLTVQNALLEIVTARRVDQLQLPAGVRCAAALDPVATVPGVPLLTAPLANRLVHLDWTPDASWWVDGFLSDWHISIPALPDDWEHHLPSAKARVGAFIRAKPHLLHCRPQDWDKQSGPWPSGRTWDLLCRLLAACDAARAGDEVRALLAVGAVGKEAGAEYLRWERENE